MASNHIWVHIATTYLCFVLVALWTVEAALLLIAQYMKWRRRRAADARIIAQAKGAGVWDSKPIILGGRALELRAWQEYRLKRKPGEPDAHLRRRCIAADDMAKEKSVDE